MLSLGVQIEAYPVLRRGLDASVRVLYNCLVIICKLKDMFMLCRKIIVLLTFASLSFISYGLLAKTSMVEVKLVDIEAKKLTERKRDELFMTITEYPSKGNPKVLRIPAYPMHWLSRDLNNINNVLLWKGQVTDDSSVLLIISLMEQDIPLLGIDDHIGSAQVKIINHRGKLTTTWGQPHFVDQPKVTQNKVDMLDYLMFGNGGEYEVKFKVNIVD